MAEPCEHIEEDRQITQVMAALDLEIQHAHSGLLHNWKCVGIMVNAVDVIHCGACSMGRQYYVSCSNSACKRIQDWVKTTLQTLQRSMDAGAVVCNGPASADRTGLVTNDVHDSMVWMLTVSKIDEYHSHSAMKDMISRMCAPIIVPSLINNTNTRLLRETCEAIARRIRGSDWIARLSCVWIGVALDLTDRNVRGYPCPDVRVSTDGTKHTMFGFLTAAHGVRDD